MDILTILIVGILNVVCFYVGAKVGQTVSKGERLEIPKLDPVKKIQEHQDKKQAQKEQDRFNTIMQNIENYDGTSNGQRDVQKR